jgi:hypothetical protein
MQACVVIGPVNIVMQSMLNKSLSKRCYFDLPRGLGNESGEALDLPHHYRKVRSKCRNRWMSTSFRCVGYEFRLAKREEELVNALPARDRSHSRC